MSKPTPSQIESAWKRWPRLYITSAAQAVEFVEFLFASAPTDQQTEGQLIGFKASTYPVERHNGIRSNGESNA